MPSPFASSGSASTWFAILFLAASAPLLRAATPYPGKPYLGKPQEVPGTIQAIYYDVAPGNVSGVTYNRKGTPKPNTFRTTGDAINILRLDARHVSVTGEKQSVGGYVGSTAVGDWWKYTLLVKEDGTYRFGLKTASAHPGARISVSFDPLDPSGTRVTTGSLEIPTTAGFQPGIEVYHVWETLDNLAPVKLAKGLYVMTVKVEAKGAMNFDNYTLTLER